MDAMKLLKGLLGNKNMSRSLGRQLLEGVLGGGRRQPSSQPAQHQSRSHSTSGGVGDLFKRFSHPDPAPSRSAPSQSAPSHSGQRHEPHSTEQKKSGGLAAQFAAAAAEADPTDAGASAVESAARSGAAQMGATTSASRSDDRSGGAGPSSPQDFKPLPTQNEQAILMIRAMVNAAKSDGRIDREEQENIVKQLGDVSQSEIDFLRQEFAAELDVNEFSKSIPRGMEQEIYAMSVTAIDLDTNKEARYLHQLAQGLDISQQQCNAIHDHFGIPKIYG